MPSITTQSIHNTLKNFRRHKAYAENVFIYSHESDVFMVDQSDRVTEYEVKASRSDYHADFLKTEKHKKFISLHDVTDIPNEFYYVCPEGMIKEDQIPEYAGLIYVKVNGLQKQLIQVKKAEPLHNQTMASELWEEMYLKMMAKRK